MERKIHRFVQNYNENKRRQCAENIVIINVGLCPTNGFRIEIKLIWKMSSIGISSHFGILFIVFHKCIFVKLSLMFLLSVLGKKHV